MPGRGARCAPALPPVAVMSTAARVVVALAALLQVYILVLSSASLPQGCSGPEPG